MRDLMSGKEAGKSRFFSEKTRKLTEFVLTVVSFFMFIHFLTAPGAGSGSIWFAFVFIIFYAAAAFYNDLTGNKISGRLPVILSALGGGFWLFCFFRYFGFVDWPIGYSADFSSYLWLLYYHFVFSATILVLLFVICFSEDPKKIIALGKWEIGRRPVYGKAVLIFIAVSVWLYAFYIVWQTEISASGPVAGFVGVCLLKAFLTGSMEELCYRHIIQSAAIERYGVIAGIVFQSLLYGAFHIHLGAVVFPGLLFPAGVILLGAVFGIVTYHTSGISWAFTVHMGIDVVIEWLNLALT